MSSRPPIDGSTTRPRPLEVAIVGNDALVAALPARPVQLSHAILAMGFDVVIPVSWGEELLAEHALRALSVRGRKPAIFCACTRLRERLLSSGSELASNLIAFVPPAVAAARHIRALHPTVRMRVTFIGGCDTGGDPAINSTISAADFLHRLAERGISAVRQPAVFDSIIPPDRRRHYSLPGGCPAPDALASRAPEWQQVTVDDESFAASLAELLISGERLLIDLAPRLACSCCSALGTTPDERTHTMARGRLADIEPPRAPAPILDHDVEISVDATPVRRIRAGTGPDSLARAYLGADAATRPPALGMPTSALPIPHPIREMGALTSAPREPDMRARVAHEHLLRDGGTRDHLTAALPVAPSPLQLEQPRREHQVDERVAQEADERISVSEELAPREASPSEREVMRTALPGDAGAAERTRGVFRIDAPRDHTSRRRIAVTPASVPITLPRVAMVATPTLAMVGESRKTAPSAGSAVRAPELTPIAGVEEVPVESEKTIPLERLTSDVDERAGAVVNATTAAAFTPEAQIEDTRIHDEGQANATQNLPTTSQLPRTHAAGRRHRTRVHETFLVARLAAHARATRAASARERGMASERPAIADTAPSSVDDAAIEHAFGAATEVVPAEPSREGAPNVDLVDSRRLDTPEAAAPLMEYGASDPATLIDVEVVVRIIDESAGVTRLASRTPRATGRVDDVRVAEVRPALVKEAFVNEASVSVALDRVAPDSGAAVSDAPGSVAPVSVAAESVASSNDALRNDALVNDASDIEAMARAIPVIAVLGSEGSTSHAPVREAPVDEARVGAAPVSEAPVSVAPPSAAIAAAAPPSTAPANASPLIPAPRSSTPVAHVTPTTGPFLAPLSSPIESPVRGARFATSRGRIVKPPLLAHSERRGEERKERKSSEPHPLVTLVISAIAIVAVLVALALVLQRNPLAP